MFLMKPSLGGSKANASNIIYGYRLPLRLILKWLLLHPIAVLLLHWHLIVDQVHQVVIAHAPVAAAHGGCLVAGNVLLGREVGYQEALGRDSLLAPQDALAVPALCCLDHLHIRIGFVRSGV